MLLKIAMVFAAASGATGVALGAFGAHGLKGSIEPRLLETFQTGVHYQLVHSLALFFTVLLTMQLGRSTTLDVSVVSFMAGILLFSGSLYGLALTEIRWFGPITPLGGLCFIAGWVSLVITGLMKVG